eukprot:gnl/TRDRNA2_/TRDRNA2_175473_c1_seq1.p1 gnl/TRDRNA2_/TRDRNA2_175473_c1~~gnl/TRDRNA2_/TRDRNA2_175473_c1_seq1.p1  ORF type:complete len:376 (-),score=37.89 gnl/TRDRNA2_/TRDRNA2_175473_c1_seq1:32-1159(-)
MSRPMTAAPASKPPPRSDAATLRVQELAPAATSSFEQGLVPIYEYYKPSATKTPPGWYLYTPSDSPKQGWGNQRVAFYAYASPREGAVPVQEYHDDVSGNRVYMADGKTYGGASQVAFYALRTQKEDTSGRLQCMKIYENYHAATNSYRYASVSRQNDGWAEVERGGFYAFWPKNMVMAESRGSSTLEPNWNLKAARKDAAPSSQPSLQNQLVPIYEYFKPGFTKSSPGWYLYTPSSMPLNGWTMKGYAFYALSAPAANAVPVYEYYDKKTGNRVYIADGKQYGAASRLAFYAFRTPIEGANKIHEYYHKKVNRYVYSSVPTAQRGWTQIAQRGFYAFSNPPNGTANFRQTSNLQPDWALPSTPEADEKITLVGS